MSIICEFLKRNPILNIKMFTCVPREQLTEKQQEIRGLFEK